jgi:serine/threonine-protein kinase
MDPTVPDNETTRIPTATFEAVAVELGLLTPAQVDECLLIHRTLLDLGLASSIAEVCLKKGMLSAAQLAAVETALGRRGEVVFPGYEILGKIAEGGMGAVYKARQISMDRLVAIKVMLPKFANDQSGRERFLREARAVAKLSHPNIVAGIDAGEVSGVCYFVMEYLDGEPMDQELRRAGPLPWRDAAAIVRQVALALEHADRHGIVHRDVKPGNIMLLEEGAVKLADLGLALATASGDPALTQAGMIVGSPGYLSPEQARGEATLDIRSDIFSLGLSLYEFVSGQRAYAGSNPLSVLTALLTRDVEIDKLAALGVPAGLTAVVAKMTQREPARRYQTPRALCEDLDAVLAGRAPAHALANGLGDAGAAGASAIPAARSRGRRVLLIALLALLLVAIVFWPFGKSAQAPPGLQAPVVATAPVAATAETELGLDLIAAIERAKLEAPGETVYHAEQELDRYSIDFAVRGRTVNVVIDARNGSLVEKLEEDGDHTIDVQMARVSLLDAVQAVQKAAPGRAVEAGIMLLPGRAVIEVKLIRDGKAVWLDVDGVSGAVSAERGKSLQTS